MKIGVDGFPVSGPRTGVGRYVAELVKAAASYAQVRVAMDRTGSDPDVSDLIAKGVDVHYAPWLVDQFFWKLGRAGRWLPYDLKVGCVEAMVFTRYTRFPMRQDVPELSFVYDFAFLHVPETIDQGPDALLANVPPMIEASDYVGVISKTMARECAEAFPGSGDKIVVLEPGLSTGLVDADVGDPLERIRRLGLRPGYLLFVGSIEPRKNLLPLIEAVNRLVPDTTVGRPLVIAGGPGWRNEEILAAIDNAPDRVRRLSPFVDDATLKALYLQAAALVFPSRYEGFGLPLLEAMQLGTPVACSDIPVFHEVAGSAALYFDPDDPDDIAATLERLIHADEEFRDGMVARGRDRASAYSWERSARRLVKTLAGEEGSGFRSTTNVSPVQKPRTATSASATGVRIAVISTPRSGNTWLRHLLADALHADSRAVHEPGELPWRDLPRRLVLQLHWYPDDELLELLHKNHIRVCTISRHPCDVLVSILRYSQAASETARWLRGEGGDETQLAGATPAGPAFSDYVSSPRARALLGLTPAWTGQPGTRLLRYEDLVADTVGTITSAFGDEAFEAERLSDAVERRTLGRSRRRDALRSYHFWRGEVGLWRRLVPSEIANVVAAVHTEAMEIGEYDVDRTSDLSRVAAERNWYALEAESLRQEMEILREQTERLRDRLQEVESDLAFASKGDSQEVRYVLQHELGLRSLKIARALKLLRDRVTGRA